MTECAAKSIAVASSEPVLRALLDAVVAEGGFTARDWTPEISGNICLAVIDVDPPGRIGLVAEARRVLRDRGAILAVGTLDRERRTQALAAGADDVLQRPLTADSLAARIDVLRARRAALSAAPPALPAVLAASDDDFRRVVDTIGYAVVLLRDRAFLYANAAAAELVGYDGPESLIGRSVAEVAHPDELAEAMERIGTAERSGEAVGGMERRLVREDGELVTVALSPLKRVTFGGDSAILVVARDVTDDRLIETRLRLADRLTSVGTLAAGVAHEVNNPLASVVANLSVLEEELVELSGGLAPEDAEELMEVVADAREGADRVKQIVRDLSTFARVDATTLGLVDINRSLEATLNIAAPQIRHRARVNKSLGPVPPIRGNEARLGQVFLHLVLNAVHAMPTGRAAENELRVWTRSDGPRTVLIGVEDTGRGMSEDVKRRIFEPFYTTKPVGEGIGLGLSISHSIVEQMGGSIDVVSAPEEGSKFTIRLPAARRERRLTPDGMPAQSRLSPARILVADDEPMITKSLQRLLKGHQVTVAGSGREALENLRNQEFDLVVCDLIMPDLSGIDVYEELQRMRPGDEGRIVFITGGAFTAETSAFLQNIPNIWIEKPFDLKAVRAFLDLELGGI